MVYYVETYRPPYPEKGTKIRVHREEEFCRDILSPSMTSVWKVEDVDSKQAAIAAIIERASGVAAGSHNKTATLLFGSHF